MRNEALRQIPESQEERRAALEGQRQQTRTLQAEAQAARAGAQANRASIQGPSLDRQQAFERQL